MKKKMQRKNQNKHKQRIDSEEEEDGVEYYESDSQSDGQGETEDVVRGHTKTRHVKNKETHSTSTVPMIPMEPVHAHHTHTLSDTHIQFMQDYHVKHLPQIMLDNTMHRMVVHYDFSRQVELSTRTGDAATPIPLISSMNEHMVQIVGIGCKQWSLKGDTSILINITNEMNNTRVLGTRQFGGKTAAFTLLSNKTSETPELIYLIKNESFLLRKQFPDITESNCENGVQPVIGKRPGEIIYRFLPVGHDEHGDAICPLGHFTKRSLDEGGVKYPIVLSDNKECIKISEQFYQKWVEGFKDIIKECHLSGDLRKFNLHIEPTSIRASYFGSMLLEIFYVKL